MCSEHRVTSLRSPRRSRHPPRRSNEMSFLNRRTNARVILYRFLPPERRAPVVIPRVARRRVRRQLDAHAPGNRRGDLSRSSRPSAPLAARASPHPRGFVTIEKHAIQRVRRVARGRLPPEASPTATAATDHAAAASSSSSDALPPSVAALVPTLSLARKKGACGVVGVLGGCAEYAGAPFFAAMASIRRVLYTGPHTTASAW